MLENERKKCEEYLSKKHSKKEILMHLVTLTYLTRGEIFEIMTKNNSNKKNNFLLVISILNLIAMLLLIIILGINI